MDLHRDSANEALPGWLQRSKRIRDQMEWGKFRGLSTTRGYPGRLDLIERFEDRWEWWRLSQNEALPWSPALIERFADRWGGNAFP